MEPFKLDFVVCIHHSFNQPIVFVYRSFIILLCSGLVIVSVFVMKQVEGAVVLRL